MIDMSSIDFDEIKFEILVIVLSLVIAEIYHEIKTKRIILIFRQISYYLFNKSVRIRIFHIQKYKNEPKRWLSNNIFQEIQEEVSNDKLLRRGIDRRCIKLYSDNLGHTILIWLEEEFDSSTLGSETPEIIGYNSKVEIQDEIRLGRRDFDELSYFVNIASVSQERIRGRCLPENSKIDDRFAVCNVRRDFESIAKRDETITMEKIDAKISISGNSVTIILRELSYVTEVLKKYFFK